MEIKNGWKVWMSILIAGGMLFSGAIAPAFADVEEVPAETSQPAVAGNGVKHFFEGVLMRTFRYQKSMTAFIGASLEDTSGFISSAKTRIDELIEEGKDVARLEEAITQFEKLIDESQNAYSAAQSLVDLHSGFDGQGKVENLKEARETIRAIEPSLSTAREKIIEAVRVVNGAVQEYQIDNEI
ncbi:MAG: hypothetical protein J7K66_07095 [Anaerolineaceae bacterium]|nr:hypothetical protein [Anaerolineaceae bacterium]